MLNILFIGDISGKIGRKTVQKVLPGLRKKLKPDLIIANAENIAHGTGVTEKTLKEVMEYGVDWFTCGDHSFKREKENDVFNNLPIIRPANFPDKSPGNGYTIIKVNSYNILLINLIGRVFMHMDYDCPFRKVDKILKENNLDKKNISAIIIDIHAEATSEKIALKHYLDGKVSALLGTHTHVMTADNEITKKGTAYISDVGMTGFADGCIGIEKENIIKTFLTQIKSKHNIPDEGRAIFNAVSLTINPKTGKTTEIKPIIKFVKIN